MAEFLFNTRAGLMLFGVFVLVILLVVSYYISRPLDRWWVGRQLGKRTSEAYHPRQTEMPSELAADRGAFLALGFKDVTVIANPDGSVHALLLSDDSRSIGEVAKVKGRKGTTWIVLELTSSLAAYRGLLTTSDFGLGLHLWDAELRQVFPGASDSNLVQYHREALDGLAGLGLAPDPVAADEVLQWRADFLRRMNDATAHSTSKAIRSESMRTGQGRHAFVGALLEDHDFPGRLDRFWQAIDTGPASW